MTYKYGSFSDDQISYQTKKMHNEIHKLLLYKDPNIENKETIFKTDNDYIIYFNKMLHRFGGLNAMLGEPLNMIDFMSTLQAAMNIANGEFDWSQYRCMILDAHGYLSNMFKEG